MAAVADHPAPPWVAAAPAEKRFPSLVGEHGLDHPDVGAGAHKITHGSTLDVGLLLLVVWAIVAKPTL